jgi:uncharacterized protein
MSQDGTVQHDPVTTITSRQQCRTIRTGAKPGPGRQTGGQLDATLRSGTRTTGDEHDILYTLRPGHRLGWEIDQLADELAELFSRPVDLVSLRALHPLLRPTVLAEARPLYAA